MEDLSLHILDVAENSISAGAETVWIRIMEDTVQKSLEIEIKDDGSGMDSATVKQVLDPFFTTRKTRRVGLGLSMLAQSARETGGDLVVDSGTGEGTRVKALFYVDHPDCRPVGDIQNTLATLVAGFPDIRLVYDSCRDGETQHWESTPVSGISPP